MVSSKIRDIYSTYSFYVARDSILGFGESSSLENSIAKIRKDPKNPFDYLFDREIQKVISGKKRESPWVKAALLSLVYSGNVSAALFYSQVYEAALSMSSRSKK